MNEVYRPAVLGEALRIRAANGAVVFAGGTDLMVKRRTGAGVLPAFSGPVLFLDRVGELKGISRSDGEIRIGSMTTISELMVCGLVHPVFRKVAGEMGGPALRNVATLGGNVCNASPAGDTLPFLYAFDAGVSLASERGERRIVLEDFITAPGATGIGAGEILVSVLVPDWKPGVAFWRKVGTRKANALTKVSMAAFAQLSSRRITRVRIALGAVAPTVVRLRKVEQLLEGASRSEIGGDSLVVEARTLCEAAVRPIDDQRSTAEYRREVAANLLSSFIEILRERFATSAATRKSI